MYRVSEYFQEYQDRDRSKIIFYYEQGHYHFEKSNPSILINDEYVQYVGEISSEVRLSGIC